MTRIVLIGAGHAHLEVLRQAHRFAAEGATLTLIEPGMFWYSGAATGLLAAALPKDRVQIDPDRVSSRYERIAERARAIDADQRRVELESGQCVDFDILSISTGSQVAAHDLKGPGVLPAKPISNLLKARSLIETASGQLSLAVVGSGVTGVEIALNLAALQRRLKADVQVTLIGPDPLLPGWPNTAAVEAEKALRAARVERLKGRAVSRSGAMLSSDSGRSVQADLVIVAPGLRACLPSGLNPSDDGLPVGPDLAWVGGGHIFAAGDCAYLTHAPRPKLGVFGVRAAPVLVHNLLNAALGVPSRKLYHPQSRWLSVIDLGDGRGLARYGRWSGASRLALGLKRLIDRRFVDRYQGD